MGEYKPKDDESEPNLFNQIEINDLIRDLKLPNAAVELIVVLTYDQKSVMHITKFSVWS